MEKTCWYKEAVVYQIYPFSFKDSDNDGWGDIPGIISKLDHVKELGATAIWFSPLYASPLKDYGYDISDYRAINPLFGTMEDFDRLVEECHSHGLKVIMDMVVNHTSTEHTWFKAALSAPDSPYRDYYIIRKGKKQGRKLLPPTNWQSSFTGSAWERIGGTDEFYLHLFCKEQADLNWENPKVREAVADTLDFYMKKGVDGFRFDVFNMFSKVYPFGDDTSGSLFEKGCCYFVDGPRMHEFLKELNEKALSHYDSFTVGESYRPDPEEAFRYIREDAGELDSIFNFEHLNADSIGGLKFLPKKFDLLQFKRGLLGTQMKYYDGAWNTLVLENHDCPRSISRFGIRTGKYRYEAATFLALITFMGFGTPFIYQGEEIGMTNADFRSMDELMDPVSHFVYDMVTAYPFPKKLAFKLVSYGARDHARVPMQWTDGVNGGFNEGAKPWQCMSGSQAEINAEKDKAAEKSVFRFYQKLLKIKKEDPAAIYGKVTEYDHEHKKVIAYSREYEGRKLFVVGNFSDKPCWYCLPADITPERYKVKLSNYTRKDRSRTLELKPYEAILFAEKEQ